MPPLIIAGAEIAVGIAASTAVGIGTIAGAIAGALASAAVAFIGNAIFGPKKPDQPVVPQTVTSRQAVSPRQVVYGWQRKGGVITFIGLSPDNQTLHLVITLAGHQVQSIGEMYIGTTPVGLDASGSGTGVYAGFVFVEKKLGAPGEAAFPELVSVNLGWTTKHLQEGCAAVHIAMVFSPSVFSGFSFSQISFDVFGANQIYDPRTATRGYTDNAALCVADYLTNTVYGLGSSWSTEMSLDDAIAAANTSDELVAVQPTSAPITCSPANFRITLTEALLPVSSGTPSGMFTPLLGDVVNLSASSGGSLPSGLAAATDYYWIPVSFTAGDFSLSTSDIFVGLLAASLADAMAGTPVNFSGTGSGTLTLTRTAERRYTCNGTLSVDQTPAQNLQNLLSALGGTAGRAIWTSGEWVIQAGEYRTPTVTLSEGDLRKDGFQVQMLSSRRSSFNAVRGTFINPAINWLPDSYPPAKSDVYLAQDNGQQAFQPLDLPFTLSGSMAQRIATMELNRNRLETQLPQLPCKLSALQLRAGDTMMLDYARYGWSGQIFEVQALAFVGEQDAAGAPVLGVDLALRLNDPSAYAWSATQELPVTRHTPTTLPDPNTVHAPGVPAVSEVLYDTRTPSGVKSSAVITAAVSPDAFARTYQFEYGLSGSGSFAVLPPVPAPTQGDATVTATVFDIQPGTYDFRVKALNGFGASSPYAMASHVQMIGLSAPPSSPTGFTVSGLSGFAHLQWDPPVDLDVKIGGSGRIRWSPLTSGATWANAMDFGPVVSSSATSTVLPLSAGTYLFKWLNSNGVECATAASFVVTAAANIVTLANTTTVTEDPTFAGTKTDCLIDGPFLKLVGSGNVDSVADFDLVADVDTIGGIVSSGTYDFASGIDLGSVKPCRISSSVGLAVVNTFDQIDARTASVDDWLDWDGSTAASAGATLYARSTPDNPGGSPTWSDWQRLITADFNARAFQFRLVLTSSDPAYNAEINALSVTAKYN